MTSNPDGADARSTADDHLRLIKAALKRSFPMVGGAVSASHAAISRVNDLSQSAQAQLNELRDGSATAKCALVATTCISASSADMLGGFPATSYARLDSSNIFQGGQQRFTAGTPRHIMVSETAPATEQAWVIGYAFGDGTLRFGTADDGFAWVTPFLTVDRTGTAPTTLAFYGTSITFNGADLSNPTQLNGVGASAYARLDTARTFTKGTGNSPVDVAYASTITLNCELGDYQRMTLTGSTTLAAPTSGRPGQVLILRITQGGSGSYTVTWNSVFRFAQGVVPTLSTAVGAHDVFAFIYDDLLGYWLQAGLDVKR